MILCAELVSIPALRLFMDRIGLTTSVSGGERKLEVELSAGSKSGKTLRAHPGPTATFSWWRPPLTHYSQPRLAKRPFSC